MHLQQQHGNGIVCFFKTGHAVSIRGLCLNPSGQGKSDRNRRFWSGKPLPGTRILHRYPRFGWREAFALLQDFERNTVGRTNEGHVTVTRRPVDHDAILLKVGTEVVNIVDLIGQVPEIAAAGVIFGVPIVGEFKGRRLFSRAAETSSRAARKTRVKRPFRFRSGVFPRDPSGRNRISLIRQGL